MAQPLKVIECNYKHLHSVETSKLEEARRHKFGEAVVVKISKVVLDPKCVVLADLERTLTAITCTNAKSEIAFNYDLIHYPITSARLLPVQQIPMSPGIQVASTNKKPVQVKRKKVNEDTPSVPSFPFPSVVKEEDLQKYLASVRNSFYQL